uniref:Aspergillus niger bphA benzoate-para-hydroxylase a member of the cytochrome P450 superfamily n=1 Tax=Aspergillus niger TaxID=5061 RepID=V9H1E9_ASPNG|nr:hypothetical protein (bphA 5' region) - Aspergillus niger [Aspergillus niger]CAA36751.1 unnamed protein product [Aspergillus niger]
MTDQPLSRQETLFTHGDT